MTEQEWLAQSDIEKEQWIAINIFPYSSRMTSYMNWHGFGMIVEKMPNVFYRRLGEHITHVKVIVGSKTFTGKAPTAWEAAALSYGKMKGLI